MPDHGPSGDASFVEQERSFLVELQRRALALKAQGESAEKAGQQITVEFKKKYADWNIDDLTSFVKQSYTDGH